MACRYWSREVLADSNSAGSSQLAPEFPHDRSSRSSSVLTRPICAHRYFQNGSIIHGNGLKTIRRYSSHRIVKCMSIGFGFRSVAILDAASLLATCAYIDLNPVAAGIAATPEKSPHTSFKAIVNKCADHGKLATLQDDSRYASKVNFEQGHWLFPIENRRDPNGNGLAGVLHGISLPGHVQLVD